MAQSLGPAQLLVPQRQGGAELLADEFGEGGQPPSWLSLSLLPLAGSSNHMSIIFSFPQNVHL